jgi:sigma-B regulation protein RsbU (phosphoserine phosphatase)
MMTAKTMIKTQIRLQPDPMQVLKDVNEALFENNADNMFVTVWLGILDTETRVLTYADAGHERLFLYQEGEWKAMPKQAGMALAIFSGEELEAISTKRSFRNCTIQLAPGDAIFQYSDGVTEAMDVEERMFGEDRLLETINRAPSMKPDDLVKYLHRSIDDFVGEASQFDDITMLCMQVN